MNHSFIRIDSTCFTLTCAFISGNTVTTALMCFPHKLQKEFIRLAAKADGWKVILFFLFPMPYPH